MCQRQSLNYQYFNVLMCTINVKMKLFNNFIIIAWTIITAVRVTLVSNALYQTGNDLIIFIIC